MNKQINGIRTGLSLHGICGMHWIEEILGSELTEIPVVLIVLLFPALAMGDEVKLEDLVIREDLYYK